MFILTIGLGVEPSSVDLCADVPISMHGRRDFGLKVSKPSVMPY